MDNQLDQYKQRVHSVLKRVRRLQVNEVNNHLSGHVNDGTDDEKGCLVANLRYLEREIDSDATESSSGGESCDELDSAPPRTVWGWASDRSKIASTWTWLQAQVTDLEYKIRQQNELMHQFRAEKSPIFGVPAALVPSIQQHTTLPASKLNIRTTAITTIIPSGTPSSTSAPTTEPTPTPPQPQPPPLNLNPTISTLPETCSRALPLSANFRQRRLVKSSSILADAPKKALIRYSTFPCACSSLPQSFGSCIACNGRDNCAKIVERNTTMPLMERVALLDTCCHPVLSFPEDVSLGVRLSLMLKKEPRSIAVKNRPGRKRKSDVMFSDDLPHLNEKQDNDSSTSLNMSTNSCASAKPGKSQLAIASSKLRRKYGDQPKKRKHSNSTDSISTGKRTKRDRRGSSKSESSNCASPASPQSCSNSSLQNSAPVNRRRRSEQHAYDIDNIVIPFSIAATTRVEKLEYKEIITPTWRVCENGATTTTAATASPSTPPTNGPTASPSTPSTNGPNATTTPNNDDDEIEDLSDEVFAIRHLKCEVEEKKRFLTTAHNNLMINNACLV